MKQLFSKFLVAFLLTSAVVLSWSEYFFLIEPNIYAEKWFHVFFKKSFFMVHLKQKPTSGSKNFLPLELSWSCFRECGRTQTFQGVAVSFSCKNESRCLNNLSLFPKLVIQYTGSRFLRSVLDFVDLNIASMVPTCLAVFSNLLALAFLNNSSVLLTVRPKSRIRVHS